MWEYGPQTGSIGWVIPLLYMCPPLSPASLPFPMTPRLTDAGATGHIMVLVLFLMVTSSVEFIR